MLILNKILAVYVGPSGYAAIGQFQNVITISLTAGGAAAGNGVVALTAAHPENIAAQRAVWRTAFTLSFVASGITALAILFLHKVIANAIFGSDAYAAPLLWFAGALVMFVANSLLLSVLNGRKEIGRLVAANIGGSILTLIATGALAYRFGLKGALIAVAVNQSLAFFFSLFLCARSGWFKLSDLIGPVDKAIARKLAGFAAMAVTSAIAAPLGLIATRSYLGRQFGWEQAGLWEAMLRISGLQLMFLTTILGTYYLPRMAEIRDRFETRGELFKVLRLALPVSIAGTTILYNFRERFIALLFDDSFLPMAGLFGWQLIGDNIKIVAWSLSFILVARANTKAFIILEVAFSALSTLLAVLFSSTFGFAAVTMAHPVVYTLYLVAILAFLARRKVI